MNKIFEIKNIDNVLVVDSRVVSDIVDQSHSNLLYKIRNHIKYLSSANIPIKDFFIESEYLAKNLCKRNNFLITKEGFNYIINNLVNNPLTKLESERYLNMFDVKNIKNNEIRKHLKELDNKGVVICSSDLSNILGKQHTNLVSEIRRYKSKFERIPHLCFDDMFIEDIYVDSMNNTRPCYLITKKGYNYIINKMIKFREGYSRKYLLDMFEEAEQDKVNMIEFFKEARGENVLLPEVKSGHRIVQTFELKGYEGIPVISSEDVARIIDKEHKCVVNNIGWYIRGSKELFTDLFIPTSHTDGGGVESCAITRKGCDYLTYKISKKEKEVFKKVYTKLFDEVEERLEKEEDLVIREAVKDADKLTVEYKSLSGMIDKQKEEVEVEILDERELLGKQFKIYGTPDEPLFLAKDVAEWIEYDSSKVGQMLKNIDENEYITSPIYYSGQVRNMYFLTEEGLYEVLMQSRKPIAKEFKKQVKIILKDIRKHGMYATDELLENPDLLIQVATKLKQEKERNNLLVLENKKKEDRIEHLKPHADFSKEFLKSEDTIQINSLSKHLQNMGIDIGRNRLFSWLRSNRYVCIEEGYNVPTQKSYNLGIMELDEKVFRDRKGNLRNGRVTKVTPRGMAYFYKLFKERKILV